MEATSGEQVRKYRRVRNTEYAGRNWNREIANPATLFYHPQKSPMANLDSCFCKYLDEDPRTMSFLEAAVKATPAEEFPAFLSRVVQHYRSVQGSAWEIQNERVRLLTVLKTVCPPVA